MEPTIVWSSITLVLSGLAALSFKHPKKTKKVLIVFIAAMCVIYLATDRYQAGFYHAYYKLNESWRLKSSSVKMPEILSIDPDSLFHVYKNNRDTVIQIIADYSLKQQRESDRFYLQVNTMTETSERMMQAYAIEADKIDQILTYERISTIALLIIFLLCKFFNDNGKPNSKEINNSTESAAL